MPDTAHVYLIVSGDYSDYSVSCAFTTEELATEYAARQNNVTVDIQRRYQHLNQYGNSSSERQEAQELAREHKLHYDSFRVETCDLHDSLPIA